MSAASRLHTDFDAEFDELPPSVQDEIFSGIKMLKRFGPHLGRPWVDTLKGSAFSNMKELRCATSNGVWRIAFAFDRKRNAILLVGGDKSGGSARRFYKELIAKGQPVR